MLLMYTEKRMGPRADPCGAPAVMGRVVDD